MSLSVTIVRYPYEEPYHLRLVILASNRRLRGQIEICVNADALTELAGALEAFPRHATDEHLWEIGSERPEDRFGFYFRFRVFTTNKAGHCALQLRFNNNQDLPDREITEFCIHAEPSALNRLGRLFREIADLQHQVLHWTPAYDRLYKTPDEAVEIRDIFDGE